MVFGQKINKHNMQQLFRKVKSHLSSGYSHAKNILHDVDDGVRTFKDVYRHIEPIISELAGRQRHRAINNDVIHGLSQYENIRNKLIDVDHHVNQVAHVGKKVLPLLGLN